MCEDVATESSVPRRCSRQTHQSNVPASTPSEYYCRSLSIPLIDHLLSEMQSRFSSHQQTALLGLSIVPSVMVSLSSQECDSEVSELADMYRCDLASQGCVTSELHCWQMKCHGSSI